MIYEKKFKILSFVLAMLIFGVAFSAVPAKSYADVNVYHTYHNSLGGRVITQCELGAEFMERYFPLWVYDGPREWDVEFISVGVYVQYDYEGCTLYTNSLSVKLLLNLCGVKHSNGYHCMELDWEE